MTSDGTGPREAYVWIWLPGKVSPVVAGRIRQEHAGANALYVFVYARSYLNRPEAISIFEPELPLGWDEIGPNPPLSLANALRDGSPDAWGRRVIEHRLAGDSTDQSGENDELCELTYMLRSGSDRIGALDFQASPRVYVPREAPSDTLETLLTAAEYVEEGRPLSPALAEALQNGTSIGGARPKVLIDGEQKKHIAKFSTSRDTYNMVKAEFVAMRLARLAGMNVAPVKLVQALDKDVLLIERFDREGSEEGWKRRAMVSALTLFGLHEQMPHYASYKQLADVIRARFTKPRETLEEMFSRMTFNILVGNTDDHARNHAAFWDGNQLTLTPAYDVCPQSRLGREASQGMLIHGGQGRSQISLCIQAAHSFLLREEKALSIVRKQIVTIATNWGAVCEMAGLGDTERRLLWRNQFLNGLAFEGMDEQMATEIDLVNRVDPCAPTMVAERGASCDAS